MSLMKTRVFDTTHHHVFGVTQFHPEYCLTFPGLIIKFKRGNNTCHKIRFVWRDDQNDSHSTVIDTLLLEPKMQSLHYFLLTDISMPIQPKASLPFCPAKPQASSHERGANELHAAQKYAALLFSVYFSHFTLSQNFQFKLSTALSSLPCILYTTLLLSLEVS